MIDPTAARDAAAHLARLDDAVPGLVVGLHVIGSAMLDDYHPGRSDLDLVAEVAHPPGETEFAAIAGAHQGDGLRVETVYVTVGGLAGAGEIQPSPWVRDGAAHRDGSPDLHAVARLQLACHSATLRGDRPALPQDVQAAKDYCRGNLVSYWLPELDRGESVLATREPDAPCAAEWLGLGPARLWHTIRTGEIVSKSRAGALAAERWPDLAEPLGDILAARAGRPATLRTPHGYAAVELGRRILAEARQD
jgi:streptomycin 3"-adenylyltransferase